MKKLLLIMSLMLVASKSIAILNSIDLGSVISCNSIQDRNYYFRQFKETYGEPIRNEEGAFWFQGKGQLYGTEIKEVFVSSVPKYNFVGVVFEKSPKELIENIKTSLIYPTNVFPNGEYWVGSDGRLIMWHKGKNTKIFCNQI